MSYNDIYNKLPNRQNQVLVQLLNGLSVSQIAKKFNLKNNTISTVKKTILFKFDVKTIIELVYLLENIGIKVNKIEEVDSNKYNIQNKNPQLINVKNSNSFFELVKIGSKDFVIEISQEGVKSIYKKVI